MIAAQNKMPPVGETEGTNKTGIDRTNFNADALRQQALSVADHLKVPLIRGAKAISADPKLLDIRPLFMRTSPAADPANARAKLEGNAIMACNEPVEQRKGIKPTRMVLCITDLDEGNLSLQDCQFAIGDFFGAEAIACIYSTSSSMPEGSPSGRRWRLVVPLAKAVSVEVWMQVQRAFGVYLESVKIKADPCMKDRAAQLSFLPNVPWTSHIKDFGDVVTRDALSGIPFHFEHAYWGTALFEPFAAPTQAAADALRQLAERDAAKTEALRQQREVSERKAAERAAEREMALANGGDGLSVVERFKATHDTAALLLEYGYTQSPEKPSDWRSPLQSSGSYATQLHPDGSWHSFSSSDAAACLGRPAKSGGRMGDAFDLFVHFAHRGNYAKAVASLAPKADVGVFTGEPMPEGFGPADVLLPFGRPRGGAKEYTLMSPGEFMAKPPVRWYVRDVLPVNGVAVVYGQSRAGKTFIVLDLLLSLLNGEDTEWFGHKIRNRPAVVVYMAMEGAFGVRGRLQAWAMENDKPALPENLRFIDSQPFNLSKAADVDGLIAAVQKFSTGQAIVVIDTQAKASAGADEQTAKDMGVVYAAAERIAHQLNGLCVTVAHAGKDESKGMRGSSAQTGAADLIMLVARDGESRTWTIEKNKDGPEGTTCFFELAPVAIGHDEEDGTELSSATVVQRDKPIQGKGKKLTANSRLGLEAMQAVLMRTGLATTDRESWRAEFYSRYGATDRGNAEAKKKAFQRAIEALAASGQIDSVSENVFSLSFSAALPPLTMG